MERIIIVPGKMHDGGEHPVCFHNIGIDNNVRDVYGYFPPPDGGYALQEHTIGSGRAYRIISGGSFLDRCVAITGTLVNNKNTIKSSD